MARAQKIQQSRPIQIGEYYAMSIFDDWYVSQKTGPGWKDYTSGSHCHSERGARQLAALMNQAREVAEDWCAIRQTSPWKDCDPQAWAIHMIACAVCKAVDSPLPSGLGQRLASQMHEAAPRACQGSAEP